MVEINILEGVTVDVEEDQLRVTGKLGSNTRRFNSKLLHLDINNGKINVEPNQKKQVFKKANMAAISFSKEVKDDIKGVSEYFEILMEAVYSHFPITMEVKGSNLNIKNMLGERSPRMAKILGDTKIDIKGNDIKIYGTKHEDVSQTAANIRKASKVRGKDERIFQDGIYHSLS